MHTDKDALLTTITRTAIAPALALLPAAMDSFEARVLLYASGLQESRFVHRRQQPTGPARGFWQFEPGSKKRGGGVWGVYKHAASRYWLAMLCERRNCPFDPEQIYLRIESDDTLAAGLARLLIFTDRARLPPLGAVKEAWTLYAKRTWCPGKPRPAEWPANYMRALAFVKEQEVVA